MRGFIQGIGLLFVSKPIYSWLIASNTLDQRLLDTLNSIQNTSQFESYEIILVLNGNAIANQSDKFLTSVKNLKVINCVLPGLTHSLNYGLQEASGEFLFRLDVGDITHPQRVETSIELMRNMNLEVLVTNMGGWKNGLARKSGFLTLRNFIFSNPAAHPTLCIKRETLLAIGGYEGWRTTQDFELWIKLILHNVGIYYLADETVTYETAGVGDSRDYRVAYKNMIGVLSKYLFQRRTFAIFIILNVVLIKYLTRTIWSFTKWNRQ